MPVKFLRRVNFEEMKSAMKNVIQDYKPCSFLTKSDFVSEICDVMKDRYIEEFYFDETDNIHGVSPKEKDDFYYALVDLLGKDLADHWDKKCSKKKTIRMSESELVGLIKTIITENQSNFLLHDILDEMFKGYKIIHSPSEEALVYVGDKLMMKREPTKAVLSKHIFDEVQNVLFYDTMKDFKDSVRIWVLKNFPVKVGNEMMYGITFKDFENTLETTKKKKK